MQKKLILSFLIFIFCINLSGCGYMRQINEMAYVVGVGIDKADDEKISLTLQFKMPQSESGGSTPGEQKGGDTSNITALGDDIFSAMAKASGLLSKEISLTHAKILVFSEKIAKDGIKDFLEALMRSNQFRPNTYVAVTHGEAKEYLENVKPEPSENPAKYYTMLFYKESRSYIPEATLKDIYFTLFSEEKLAVLPYLFTGGESDEKNQEEDKSDGEEKEKKPDDYGMAILKGDRLQIVLGPEDCMIYNILCGDFREGFFSLEVAGENVSLELKRKCAPKISVWAGENPGANVRLEFLAEVSFSPKGTDDEKIAKSAEEILEKRCLEFIEKTKKGSCDALGLGRYAKKEFLTLPEWESYNWSEKFPSLAPDVEAKIKITSHGLIR